MENAELLLRQDQTLLAAAYQEYTSALSTAAVRSDGLICVRILAELAVWSNEHLLEAVFVADESGNTEIADYLRSKIEA